MTAAASAADPSRPWRLGVLGWPVSHSRSPAMQTAALAELGLDHWVYAALPVPPEAIRDAVAALRGSGHAGANVTIPHKHDALAAADVATPAAEAIGAANTLTVLEDGTLEADNTDAPGLIEALGRDPRGLRAVVLGAGGSARACLWALREAGCASVGVWNRTPERAVDVADDLDVDVVDAASLAAHPADVLVHCTSIGLHDAESTFDLLPVTPDDLADAGVVVDLVYRPEGTPLVAAARERGTTAVDGLSVLVAQGALSLERWTGRPAPRAVMDAAARAA